MEGLAGDPSRRRGPFADDIPDPNASGLFLYLNANKMGITLDLGSSLGMKLFRSLLEDADVLVENNPPRDMEALDLQFPSLHREYPRLILTSVTPFGQTGPYRDYRGDDLITSNMGGLASPRPGCPTRCWTRSGSLPSGRPPSPPTSPPASAGPSPRCWRSWHGEGRGWAPRRRFGPGGPGDDPHLGPGDHVLSRPGQAPREPAGLRPHAQRLFPLQGRIRGNHRLHRRALAGAGGDHGQPRVGPRTSSSTTSPAGRTTGTPCVS